MEKARGRGAGEQAALGYIGWLIGCPGDAQDEELDVLAFGVSNSRKNVGVSWVGDAICEQHHYFNASRSGFLLVDLCNVGDGVGGIRAMSNISYGSDPVPEVLRPFPVSEGLLLDNVTAVLQQSNP